jgi:nitrate reductase gamma subunit
MVDMLEWARGPAFVASFILMVLGLARNLLLTIWGVIQSLRKAGDKSLPWKNLISTSLAWLLPLKKLKERRWYSLASILFHIGLILVPVFLIEHVSLWRRGIGIGWPTISQSLADGLTLLTLGAIAALLIGRLGSRNARALTRGRDVILMLLIALPFATGFLAAHPSLNPFNYDTSMLIHVLSSNLLMCLIPFTKLCHCILLPLTQLVAEVGWHFPPNTGTRVAESLGKEVESV